MNQDDIVNHTLLEMRVLIKNFHHARVKKDFGFTYNESLLMKTLLEQPDIHPGELAELLGSEKSTISRQVAVLEKKGYVQRVEEPLNRRSHRLALTSQGVDALQTSDHLWAQILEGQFENWSAKDRESFLALLRKYNESSRTNTKRLQPREGHSPKK